MPHCPHLHPRLHLHLTQRVLPRITLVTLACLALAAPAAEHAPAAVAHAAAPAAKPAPAVVAASAAGAKPAPTKGHASDPLDTLRERLAVKLGATKAPESKSPYVVRVAARASAHDAPAPAHAPVSRLAGAPSLQHIVDEHRQAKAGGGTDAHSQGPHWAYSGEGGPLAWGKLKAEFTKCSTGTRQSPIDIRGGILVDLDPVQFDYKPTGFSVLDNGHTVQVNLPPGNAIQVQGRRYELVQFHFHRPSEERINGRQFDMVAHLVHKDLDGRLAVVAVLLDRGSAHSAVQQVWNNLPLEKGEENAAQTPLDLNQLLPQDRRYFTYMGSLTTPPCSEGVLWLVMQQPVAISPQQIDIFARLYPMNARPIQQASGRLIKQSN